MDSHTFSQAERVVYDAFMSPEFVDQLVSFLSLEENKGRDKYSTSRFSMFKVRKNLAYKLERGTEKSLIMCKKHFLVFHQMLFDVSIWTFTR